MAVWLLLLLVLNIQGHSIEVHRNETNPSSNSTTNMKSIHTTSSTVPQATTVNPPKDAPTTPVYSSTPIRSASTSIPRAENKIITTQTTSGPIPKTTTATIISSVETTTTKDRNLSKFPHHVENRATSPLPVLKKSSTNSTSSLTTASQTTSGPIPKTTTTTINSSVETSTTKDRNSSKFPHHMENSATTPLPALRTSSTNSTSSRIPTEPTTILQMTTETFTIQNQIDDSEKLLSKTEYANTNGTTTENIRGHTNMAEDNPSDEEWSTTTETVSDWELETSTPEESATVEQGITEISEPTTENADGDGDSTTDLPDNITTTDSSSESQREDSTAEMSSNPTTQDYAKTELNASLRNPLCPPGRAGLACRRAEARRTADECSGGNCEKCRSCNNTAATDWPHCCRKNFRCCSELALACQQCDQPTLQEFCTKHFKRCF